MTMKRKNYFVPVLALAVSVLAVAGCSDNDGKSVDQQMSEQPGGIQSTIKDAETEAATTLSVSADKVIEGSNEQLQTQTNEVVEKANTEVAEITTEITEQVAETKTPVTETVEKVASAAEESKSSAVDQTKMLALAKESGCFACHALDQKVVGPAWRDVGAKYRDMEGGRANMIASVTKGSSGKWGSVPMPSYSPRVPDQNIASLVDFILTLK